MSTSALAFVITLLLATFVKENVSQTTISPDQDTAEYTVASFQEEGYFNGNSFMRYTTTAGNGNPDDPLSQVGSGLSQFTMCMWVTLNFLRARRTTFLSYASETAIESLYGAFRYQSDGDKFIEFCTYGPDNPLCVDVKVDDFDFQTPRHLCLVNSVSNRLRTSVLYQGGIQVASVSEVKDLTSNQEVMALPGSNPDQEISFVLGQKQQDLGGKVGFDPAEGFSGKITDIVLVNRILEDSEITNLVNCKETADSLRSESILPWDDDLSKWEVVETNITREIPPCDNAVLTTGQTAVFNHQIELTELRTICTALGGEIPVATSQQNYEEVYVTVQNEISMQLTDDEKSRGCAGSRPGDMSFWLGMNKLDNRTWVNPNNNNMTIYWDVQVFNPRSRFDVLIGQGPNSLRGARIDSDTNCGVCRKINERGSKRLLLKGMCGGEVDDSIFDTEYYVDGLRNGRLYFKGIENSHIYFNETKRWTLQSLRDPDKMLQLSRRDSVGQYPIGRFEWRVPNDAFPCELRRDMKINLTLSNCYPDMFTCNNGDCIPLAEKCDTVNTCADKSDEESCNYLQLPPSYSNEIAAKSEDGVSPLVVYMNVSIVAFPAIETVDLKITSDFYLNMRWYDGRITFANLNEAHTLNSLSVAQMESIWIPELSFTNSLGPFTTEVNRLNLAVILRESEPLDEDISLDRESYTYEGQKCSVSMNREYYQHYTCNFNLLYYPFDTQVCSLEFTVQGWTENYLTLEPDGIGVSYDGLRQLVEYTIQKEALQITSRDNKTVGIVKVVFRRRMEYHVTNTFLQTFILISVGYLTMFFRVDNFQDRIMVSLTVMLVIATIMSTIQETLPKTSYYKLIDYWLMFTLNYLAFLMGFHTYLQFVIKQDKDKLFLGNLFPPHSKSGPKDDDRPAETAHPGKRWVGYGDERFERARKLNKFGKFLMVAVVVIFNTGFWIVAMKEYVRDVDEFLDMDLQNLHERTEFFV